MIKKYGFWTLTFLVIANMIGAGVFTTSGYSLADLGSPQRVLLAWVVGGVIALAGAMSYGMLARSMPESGGEYLFLSRAAHPLLGFIAGWVSLIAGFSGAIAFAATALESYVVPENLRPAWLPANVVAVGVIVLAGAFHGLRPRLGATTQNIAVVLKLFLLTTILLFAAFQMFGANSTWNLPAEVSPEPAAAWTSIVAFAGSLVWISLSYSGFNAAVYVSSEVAEAGRVVPRAMVAGTLATTVLYVLLNAVFVYAAPPQDIVGRPDVAAVAASALGGSRFALLVRATIALGLLTSVLSMMMAAPRVYAKMADDGLMPNWLQFRGDAPVRATVAQMFLAILLVLVSSLQGLLSYLGLTLSLSAALSVCCLFLPAIRRTLPNASPMWLAFPLFYVSATFVIALVGTYNNPWQLLGTALTFLAGALMYGLVSSS